MILNLGILIILIKFQTFKQLKKNLTGTMMHYVNEFQIL